MNNPDVNNPDVNNLVRIIGVYNAKGSFSGELSYFIGKRLGRTHCALCDVTHGLVSEKKEWTSAKTSLPTEFVTFHRDDQPDSVREAGGGVAPVVVAETTSGVSLLLGPDEIEACGKDPQALVRRVFEAAESQGLTWPAPA